MARPRAATVLKALGKACADVREAAPEEGVLGVAPRFVAAPATVEEAAAVMKAAAGHGLSVIPRGGETRLDWGCPPASCDLLLDTVRLDRVVEHAAGDLIVKVEAGLPMERLAEVLAGAGQQLALDVPLPGSTVGGTLATAASGPRRLRYGAPRDLLIGVTMVRADGTVAKSGGKVVKNVAGYDLGKLLAGSYGTLGLVVEAAFRLHPNPPAEAYLTREVAPDEAAGLVRALRHSTAVPTAVEVDAPPGGPVTIAVLVDGVPEGLPHRVAQLAEVLGPGAKPADDPPDWWGAYPDGTTLIETSRPEMSHRTSAGPADVPPDDTVTAARAGSARASGPVGAGGSTGEDVAVRWSGDGRGFVATGGGPAEVAGLLAELRTEGWAVVRYAPEEVRDAVDMWGPSPALGLMRRVKDQFDPEHRLSPGRFAGGI